MNKRIFIVIIVCITVTVSLNIIRKCGKETGDAFKATGETAKVLVEKLNTVIYERLIEIKEYFNEIKSTKGDELIVAKVTYETEYKISDTKREYWTSLLFEKGISLGTNIVKVRCPTEYKYFIKISDPWIINVKSGIIYIKQPIIRQLYPPSVKLEYLEIESERGWARGSTKQLQSQALKDFMANAIRTGDNSIPQIKSKANESIIKFVNNWLLKLKDIDIDGIRVEIIDTIPLCDKINLNIQIDG